MQQRQPRLGDVLDDYCPRERRVTNHVVVAMIGDDVKQTRCTTCDADHEYKQAKVPRVRRKTESPAALAAQGFGAPKLHEHAPKPGSDTPAPGVEPSDEPEKPMSPMAADAGPDNPVLPPNEAEDAEDTEENDAQPIDEGPVHRRLIRASLPKTDGQPPPARPNPEFTIRQPGNNRQNRFRSRQGRGGAPQSNGNRSFGGGFSQRQHGGGHQRRRTRSK